MKSDYEKPTMTPDLVIFDCDGVLVDSEIISNTVLSEVLTSIGLCITPDDCMDLFLGKSWDYCLRIVRERFNKQPPHSLYEIYMEKMFAKFEEKLTPIESIEYALDNLPYPKCVASSGPHIKINKTLSITGLLHRFGENVYSANDVKEGKPAPDLFLHAAMQMGADPKNTLVIEDSIADIQAAYKAKMTPLAFCPTKTNPAIEETNSIVFNNMTELPALVNKL